MSQNQSLRTSATGRGVVSSLLCLAAAATPALSEPARAGGPPIPFTQENTVRGINYAIGGPNPFGVGAAFADLNNNGHPDLILIGRADGQVGVFENDGTGHFIDRSQSSGIPLIMRPSGVTCADYDGDGDLDLFFSNWLAPDVLMRNDGGFVFTDVSASAGVAGVSEAAATGAAWGDYDGDGLLDLYVSNRNLTTLPDGTPSAESNKLFRNLGGGIFVDVAEELGVEDDGAPTFQAVFFDFDLDGDTDLYLSTDKGPGCDPFRNHLFENIGGAFVEITDESGTEACADSMGVALGDFDGNGLPDIYITNNPIGNRLFLNQGDGVFTEAAAQAGVENFWNSWGAHFFDYNNDGRLDLYVCNEGAANRLYDNSSWPAPDVAPQLGVATPNLSYSLAAADIDNDGDIDFVVTNNFQAVRLYINHEGERRSWAKFRVVGQGHNRFGVGATVRVRTGTHEQIAQVVAGSNFKSQNELTLHFGLDDATQIDTVETLWPGGETRVVTGLTSHLTWTLYPPERLGDVDGDGAVLLNDFPTFVACFNQPFAPGCEIMDFDGDADVDETDFDAFLSRYTGPLDDCDGNGTLDLEDILADPSLDADQDGVIDSCAGLLAADLNGDGVVDGADLGTLLAQWGGPGGADLNADNVVNGADLAILLSQWTN